MDRTADNVRARFITALAVSGLSLTGCKEDPSYQLRWEIEAWPQPGATLEVNAAAICSRAGIFDVRARTFDVNKRLVDERAFACFAEGFGDPNKLVDGPALSPGEYLVELRGLTRAAQLFSAPIPEVDPGGFGEGGESGEEEETVNDRETQCTFDAPSCDSVVACDCKVVTVADDSTVAVTDFVIDQPPQCIDGLDNDGDGAVDRLDPACAGGFVTDAEDADIERTTLSVQYSFFDQNPNVSCASIGVDGQAEEIVVEVDGVERIREPCTLAPIRRSLLLEAGMHEVRATLAIGGNDEAVVPVVQPFEVRSGLGAAVDLTLDFGPEAFTPPIEREIGLLADFQRSDALGAGSFCAQPDDGTDDGGTDSEANFEIATLRIGIRDGHGGPVAPILLRTPTGANDGQPDVTIPSGGTVEVGCFESVRNTEPLVWGEYIVTVEGLSPEGEVCFSNGAGQRAAPGTAFLEPLPRVLPPPASCRDCDPGDCPGSLVCNEGVCDEPCEDDQDCDMGEVCDDSLCVAASEPG